MFNNTCKFKNFFFVRVCRIKRISSEMVSRTPSNMTDMASASAAHVMHFTDIMEYSIKEVITFCKKIPTFM